MSTNEPNGQTPGDTGQTPWPQYGQVGDASATPAPNAGSTPTGPASVPGAAPIPGGPAPYAPAQALPGRGKSITMIILGLVLMFPVALGIFFAGIASSLAGSGGLNLKVVDNGGTITVPENALVSVADGTGQASECSLSGPSDIPLQPTTTAAGKAFVAQGVPAGDYTLTCNAGEQITYSALPNDGEGFAQAGQGFALSFIISTVVGILGLVLLIVGIVLLVKTNKKRREIRGY